MRYDVVRTEISESDGQLTLICECLNQDGKPCTIVFAPGSGSVKDTIYEARQEAAGDKQPEDFPPDDNA